MDSLLLTGIVGRPAVVHLTSGFASDVKAAPDVLAAAPGSIRRLIANKGYDADALRRDLRADGMTPIISGRRTRKRAIRHDRQRLQGRRSPGRSGCRV